MPQIRIDAGTSWAERPGTSDPVTQPRLAVAVVCDYPEEGWPSMDIVGEMIVAHLDRAQVEPTRVCPPYRHRLTQWPIARRLGPARNGDRVLNRFWDYPRALKRHAQSGEFDLFHVVDHSYAQLAHVLPADRTVVTCHDLDTFRCVLEPQREPRPAWFRAMVGRTLAGLRRAAAVVSDSEATRDGLLAHGLIAPERLRVVYPGTHPEYTAALDPEAAAEASRLLGPADPAGSPEILHVGSTIPRKRIDVLLATFAAIRRVHPGARLVRAGGRFTPEQERQARELGVLDAVVNLPFCSRAVLASVYRRASLVLMPTEAEGFGLPVVEALASGTPLLASDLAVLREVGGGAPVYCPVADLPAWADAALALLATPRHSSSAAARRNLGITRARRFDWSHHADQLAEIYREVAAAAR